MMGVNVAPVAPGMGSVQCTAHVRGLGHCRPRTCACVLGWVLTIVAPWHLWFRNTQNAPLLRKVVQHSLLCLLPCQISCADPRFCS